MTATAAMLTALAVAMLLAIWASLWGVSMFLIQAGGLLVAAIIATWIVSRRHREPSR